MSILARRDNLIAIAKQFGLDLLVRDDADAVPEQRTRFRDGSDH